MRALQEAVEDQHFDVERLVASNFQSIHEKSLLQVFRYFTVNRPLKVQEA